MRACLPLLNRPALAGGYHDGMATKFDGLPNWIQNAVRQIRGDDYAEWIETPVAALGGRSLVAVYDAGEGGQRELREYFGRLNAHFDIDLP
jgi:hypothetical protein